jgi:hypothetical protein
MVEKTQHPYGNSARSGAAVFHRAWSISAIELLISVFYKKNAQQELASFKKWEREKKMDLGLARCAPRSNDSIGSDIYFSSWKNEKKTQFGLIESSFSDKKTHQNHFGAVLLSVYESLKPENYEDIFLSYDEPESTKNLPSATAQQNIEQAQNPNKVESLHKKVKAAIASEPKPNPFGKKSSPAPVLKNEKPGDDFFKILGYE